MDIFNYHPLTGEFLGTGVADDNPLAPNEPIVPGFATPTPPIKVEGRRVPVYLANGSIVPQNWPEGSWTAMPDYRAVPLFRTVDGSAFELGPEYSGLGDLPPFLTDEPRPSPAHVWLNEAWTLDSALETSQLIAAATAKRDALLAQADSEMQPLIDSFFLGENTPEEDAKRLALSQYRKALRAVTSQAGFPHTINWPVKPA